MAGISLFGPAGPAAAAELTQTREFAKVKGVFRIPSQGGFLLEHLTRERFEKHINDNFDARAEEGETVRLQLIAAEDRTVASPGEKPVSECFSILFRGGSDTPLQQGIHHFDHASMGGFDLFIVPLGPDGKGMVYEAAFNRLAK